MQDRQESSGYAGEFETHLTVTLRPEALVALVEFARARGLALLHIVLARGDCVSQPMLTRRAQGDLDGQLQAARSLAGELATAGFPVSRIKIEAAPGNAGVPQRDSELPAGTYFESHVKLQLAAQADLAALGALAQRHSSHLSRNALRDLPGQVQQRFVTQRCAGAGHLRAAAQCEHLLRALHQAGYAVLRSETEFVVHDSNRLLDRGWIGGE
jgi:hypothetical protein